MKWLLAIAVALALGVTAAGATAAYRYASSTAHDLRTFKGGICRVADAQAAQGAHFVKLLGTLERRAVARERIDRAAGRVTAAAGDADSARLYASVLPRKGAPAPRDPLGC